MNSTNIPQVKLGIVAVSRDCFPIQLSESRRGYGNTERKMDGGDGCDHTNRKTNAAVRPRAVGGKLGGFGGEKGKGRAAGSPV